MSKVDRAQTRAAIVWFRRDLRLADNPALLEAIARAEEIVPVFVLPPMAPTGSGTASRLWLKQSLPALDASLRARGSRLVVREGPPDEALPTLAAETGASLVTCTRDWDPPERASETAVAAALASVGAEFVACEGSLLVPPETLYTTDGRAYRVFTPFFRAWEHAWMPGALSPAPASIRGPQVWPDSPALPEADRSAGRFSDTWIPGEAGALARLETFVRDALADYDTDRDLPAIEGTSRLSPHLAFGEIAPVRVAAEVLASTKPDAARPFLRQFAWREFAYHVLHDFPELAERPWRPEYSAFPWRDDPRDFEAWRSGLTGYPLVDAGMRQLARTGWMHNRVRLVAGSFLVKDLLLAWRTGESCFRDALVDYDPAANAFNWQWIAGSGADAAPYFRMFNPVAQGQRFDPDGSYVRDWLPELTGLPSTWIHAPWTAPPEVLREAGIMLGVTYPTPIVDHAEARHRAHAALEVTRVARGSC
jgi:deoxyribodipyrimidine photo-lyase